MTLPNRTRTFSNAREFGAFLGSGKEKEQKKTADTNSLTEASIIW